MSIRSLLFSALVAATVATGQPAAAATLAISGIVSARYQTEVNGADPIPWQTGDPNVGDAFRVSFSFDPAATPYEVLGGFTNNLRYYKALGVTTLTVGDYILPETASGSFLLNIEVSHKVFSDSDGISFNLVGATPDQYGIAGAPLSSPFLGPTGTRLADYQGFLTIGKDPSGQALDGADLTRIDTVDGFGFDQELYYVGRFGDASKQIAVSRLAVSYVGGAVPEPASWATMALGFAAVGLALRRRRPGTAATATAAAV